MREDNDTLVLAVGNATSSNQLSANDYAKTLEQWLREHRDSLSLWEVNRVNETLKNYSLTRSAESFFADLEVAASVLYQQSKELFKSEEKKEISLLLQNFRLYNKEHQTEENKQLATSALLAKYTDVLQQIHQEQKALEEARQAKIRTSKSNTTVNISKFYIEQLPKIIERIKDKYKTYAQEQEQKGTDQLIKEFNEDKEIREFLLHIIKGWIESEAGESINKVKINTHKFIAIGKNNSKHGYKASIFTKENKLKFYIVYNHFVYGKKYFGGQEADQLIDELWKLYVYFNGKLPFTLGTIVENNEEQTKKSTVIEDLERFYGLEEISEESWKAETITNYLEKKGFSCTEEMLSLIRKGARLDGNLLLLLITDAEGTHRGIQYINCYGDKWFSSGLNKKGGFVVLGEVNEKAPRFIVCEGFATGLSLKLASPDHAVICALDAGNLELVVSSLRQTYGSKSKCEIIIAADDDYWKTLEVDKITGNHKVNIGLTKAHAVALKHRCKIVIPNFEGLNTSKLPTDFNDLMQLAGINKVKHQLSLACRPNPTLAITDGAKAEEHKRIWRQFFGHKVVSINERYIREDATDEEGNTHNIKDLILAQKVSLLRSPIGTGKTSAIAGVFKEIKGYSELYITYLTSLNKQAAHRLDLEDYTEYQGSRSEDTAKLTELQRLSICLNSLFKLLNKDGKLVKTFDVVIIDEIQQVIRRLTSSIDEKIRVLSALKQLVRSAKHLVLLDAHLDSVTIDLLEDWLPQEKFFALLNEFQVGKGRNILLYEHAGMVVDKAIEAINNGLRVFLVSNSKVQVERSYELLKEVTGKKGLFICGDNPGDKEVELFFEDPNREAPKYDFIVASPSITSGISIDEEVFGFVGGIFTHLVNTPMDCLQSLGRVRKANTFHVYTSDVKITLPTDEKEIAAKWTETHKYDERLLPSLEDYTNPYLIEVAKDYAKICVLATKEANYSRQDFLGKFIKLCVMDGYSVVYADSTPEEEDQAKFLQREARDLQAKEYVRALVSSETVSDEKREQLREKPRKTLEETRTLEKKEIIDFYRLEKEVSLEILEQTIKEDRRGKGRKELTNVEISISTDAEIQEMRREQARKGILLEPDKRNFAAEREVYRYLLMLVGINTELIANQMRYSAETLLTMFVPWVLTNYWVLKGIFRRLPTPEVIEDDPVRTLGTLLRRLGLSHKRVGKRERGEYTIDLDKLAKIREILIRREKIPIKVLKVTDNVNNIMISEFVTLIQREIMKVIEDAKLKK